MHTVQTRVVQGHLYFPLLSCPYWDLRGHSLLPKELLSSQEGGVGWGGQILWWSHRIPQADNQGIEAEPSAPAKCAEAFSLLRRLRAGEHVEDEPPAARNPIGCRHLLFSGACQNRKETVARCWSSRSSGQRGLGVTTVQAGQLLFAALPAPCTESFPLELRVCMAKKVFGETAAGSGSPFQEHVLVENQFGGQQMEG